MRVSRAVAVELVDDNPFNARCLYDDAVVVQRAREIRADGQLVAAMAIPSTSDPGHFVLIDGHYRKRAIIAAGMQHIVLDVQEPMSPVEMYRLSFALNAQRTHQTALDNALAWKRLIYNGTVPSQAALQVLLNKSEATISKTLQLVDLPDDVFTILRSAPSRFGLALAYALVLMCRSGGQEQALGLANRALTEHIAMKEVESLLGALRAGKRRRKAREESHHYRVDAGGAVGVIKNWPSGRVVVDLSFAAPSQRVRFVEELRRLVGAAGIAAS